MKRRLTGYTLVFINRDEQSLHLSVEEGQRLDELLTSDEMPPFIKIKSKGRTLRTSRIDYLKEEYENLEEKCMMCYQLKPKGQACPRGCDKPREPIAITPTLAKQRASIGQLSTEKYGS